MRELSPSAPARSGFARRAGDTTKVPARGPSVEVG
jgi:hypothetical protein